MVVELRRMTQDEYETLLLAAETFIESYKTLRFRQGQVNDLARQLDTCAPSTVKSYKDIAVYQTRYEEIKNQYKDLYSQKELAHNAAAVARQSLLPLLPFAVVFSIPKHGATVARPNDGSNELIVSFVGADGQITERF